MTAARIGKIRLKSSGTEVHILNCRLDASAQIGRTMLPSYVAEIIRRSIITEPLCDGEI